MMSVMSYYEHMSQANLVCDILFPTVEDSGVAVDVLGGVARNVVSLGI
jgi:hypothetical protein